MRSQTLRLVAVGVVCLLAVGFAAATVSTWQNDAASGFSQPRVPGQNGTGGLFDGEPRQSPGSDGDGQSPTAPTAFGKPCAPFFGSLSFYGLVGATSVASFFLFRRLWSTADAVGVALFVLVAGGLVSAVLAGSCGVGSNPFPGPEPPDLQAPNGSGPSVSGGASAYIWGPVVITAVMAVIGLPIMYFMVSRADDVGGEEVSIEERTDEAVLTQLGELAGEAADRLARSATAVDNEVFRAWREMTDLLDVDRPESSTPREFAGAAKAVGMAPAHVEALTDLFREVRYGDREATDDREERAIAALRAIEDSYADGDADGDDAPDAGDQNPDEDRGDDAGDRDPDEDAPDAG
ncbi:MAG: DUF4129 domain-containing protein [Halobacteriaceae archaeon]